MHKLAQLALKFGAAAALAGSAVTIPLAGSASAISGCGTEPADNTVYINCTAPPTTPPFTSYTDGQAIDMSMGPNSLFNPNDTNAGAIVAIECSYNGANPTSASQCDARSAAGGWPLTVHSNGSFDYATQTGGGAVTVYAFPDATFTSSAITCDATHACVWYVGENYNDFTQPKVFSAPFFVTTSGSPAPEAAFPVVLPVVGAGVIGGGGLLYFRRRRQAEAKS